MKKELQDDSFLSSYGKQLKYLIITKYFFSKKKTQN